MSVISCTDQSSGARYYFCAANPAQHHLFVTRTTTTRQSYSTAEQPSVFFDDACVPIRHNERHAHERPSPSTTPNSRDKLRCTVQS